MYTLNDVRNLISNPKLGLREINRLYYTRGRTTNGNPTGFNILAEDWDICLILDACRFDFFQNVAMEKLVGALEKRQSLASSTIEWINTSIRGKEYHDIVYVTANPKFSRSSVEETTFFNTIYTWQDLDVSEIETKAYNPDTVTDFIIQAIDDYPNKRILGHFMQPHTPFLGPVGTNMFTGNPYNSSSLRSEFQHINHQTACRRAYADNLRYVLKFVKQILSATENKVVVTADHGELLGERVWPIPIREFGHPTGIYAPQLVNVPWFIVHGTSRRKIREETPIVDETSNDSNIHNVDELLYQLGYRK